MMGRWPKALSLRRFGRRRVTRPAEEAAGKGGWYQSFKGLLRDQSTRLLRWSITLLILVILFLLARPTTSTFLSDLKEGVIPNRDVKAAFSFEYIDQEATETLRKEAAARVPPVYREDTAAVTEISRTFGRLVSRIQGPEAPSPQDTVELGKWIASLENDLGIKLPARQYDTVGSATATAGTWAAIVQYRHHKELWSALGELIEQQLRIGIVDDKAPIEKAKAEARAVFPDNREIGITRALPGLPESIQPNTDSLLTLSEFYERASNALKTRYFPGDEFETIRRLAEDVLKALVTRPTLVYDDEETQLRKRGARVGVAPVKVGVEEGKRLVTDGVPVSREEAMIVDAYRRQLGLSWTSEAGLFALALATTTIIIAYLRRYHPTLSRDPRQLAVVLLIFVSVLCLARVAAYLARSTPNLEHVGFAVPVGALGVLITLLSSGRLAAFLVAMASVYTGLILGADSLQFDLRYTMVALWSGFTAILAVHQVRQRSDLYLAGFLVAVMSVLAIFSTRLLDVQDLDQLRRSAVQLRFMLAWGLVNGGLVFMLSLATLPLFEDLLGVTTDIKLLELGQKTPLLQRLEKEAPGTYQHTMAVATLAESVAEVIGANALLTRVGAYYHDIGKMIKPAYFSENQQTAADKARHAKLKPQMSVLVIRNHVKYGLELAREYKLPRIIQDFIPEHHGTTLITYFFNQVMASSPPESVREEDFRYPGPKPRTKETAIVMLADSVEAVSRSLTEANERQIRLAVQKVVNDRFFDGQLDECNLTMADLSKVVGSLADSLTHMMHQRVKYPPRPVRRVGPGEGEPERERDIRARRDSKVGVA